VTLLCFVKKDSDFLKLLEWLHQQTSHSAIDFQSGLLTEEWAVLLIRNASEAVLNHIVRNCFEVIILNEGGE